MFGRYSGLGVRLCAGLGGDLLLLSDCRPISRAATSVRECLARAYSSPAIRTFADGSDTVELSRIVRLPLPYPDQSVSSWHMYISRIAFVIFQCRCRPIRLYNVYLVPSNASHERTRYTGRRRQARKTAAFTVQPSRDSTRAGVSGRRYARRAKTLATDTHG